MTRLAINGVAGRMGRQLLGAVALRAGESADVVLGAGVERAGTDPVGTPVSILSAELSQTKLGDGIDVVDDANAVLDQFDVIVDFTRPESTLTLLQKMRAAKKPIVIGTTGLDEAAKKELANAAEQIPVLFASNFSVGVTLSMKLLATAAKALGDDYDIEIIEAHHRNKIDAPSGTAISMGEAIAGAIGRNLDECAIYGRQGTTGVRDRQTIGFETIRGGDIIGDHTVLFAGNGERLEITHKATDRMVFASGAVRAAVWLASQPAGLYDMTHVLGIAE